MSPASTTGNTSGGVPVLQLATDDGDGSVDGILIGFATSTTVTFKNQGDYAKSFGGT